MSLYILGSVSNLVVQVSLDTSILKSSKRRVKVTKIINWKERLMILRDRWLSQLANNQTQGEGKLIILTLRVKKMTARSWIEQIARLVMGVVYFVGLLAMQLAFSIGSKTTDRNGPLKQ